MFLDPWTPIGSILTAQIGDPSIQQYNIFIDSFRDRARSPYRMACGVGVLPKPSECMLPTLPKPTPQVTLSQGKRPKGRVNRRGSIKAKKRRENIVTNLSPFLLVSLSLDGNEKILLLIRRMDLHWLAYRDCRDKWWEFCFPGSEKIPGFKGIGFIESYIGVGKLDVNIGDAQIQHAFHTLAHPPDIPSKQEMANLKKAFKTLAFAIFEAARCKILSNQYHEILTMQEGQISVSEEMVKLAGNWRKMSQLIIQNQHNQNKELAELLPEENEDLIRILEDRGMKKIGNAQIAYGLLLAEGDAVPLSSACGSY